MSLTIYGIVLFVGIVVGAYLHKLFHKDNEMNVEEAIQLLKNKGYWVKINVNPQE